MAAGLGYIEFATGDILTAAVANGYLASQTVMVFADSSARSTAITSPQEGMMSYLKDTNSVEYYSGSAWVAVGGATSPLTTKGDLYTYSTTNARLGVGSNGQILTADSSEATGLKWAAAAGGRTTLASGTLSGTVTLSSISSGYKDLRLILRNVDMTGDSQLRITVNSVTNYRYTGVYSLDNSGSSFGATSATYIPLSTPQASGASTNNSAMINFYDYATSGSGNRMIDGVMDVFNSNAAQQVYKTFAVAVTTSAIDSITITPSANNYSTGTYELIGIN